MYDINKIKSLTANEVSIISDLLLLVEEASEAEKLIRSTYRCFGIGEECITVWADKPNEDYEYLTYQGVWQKRRSSEIFEVICSKDEIFEFFRAEYLVNRGLLEKFNEEGIITEEGKKVEIAKAFRVFLQRTRYQTAHAGSLYK